MYRSDPLFTRSKIVGKFRIFPAILFFLIIMGISFPLYAENPEVSNHGASFSTIVPSPAMPVDIWIGGLLQTDYRHYLESDRSDNRFSIRRGQLSAAATLSPWLTVHLGYEFKNNATQHLHDTFAEISSGSHAFRIGYFKKPFSLEQQTSDTGIFFTERSMGACLSPGRNVGLMLKGAFLKNRILYSCGVFNADGENVGNRSDGRDDPEIVGRIVLSPLADSDADFLKHLQFGGSGSFARINMSEFDVRVKTAGMIDSIRNIYVLSNNTKFGVLQEADTRRRIGAEAAWAWRSFALQGEWIRMTYTDLKPVGSPARDAQFTSWHADALYFPTGEHVSFPGGTMRSPNPLRSFDPSAGTFGALGIAVRFERFQGDRKWINPEAFVSVEKADAFTLAFTWILTSMHRIILDYTYTDLSDPIRLRVHPDGAIDYMKKENVATLRFAIDL